jgi:5-formyltetrahydrofolate cyclo-ligase
MADTSPNGTTPSKDALRQAAFAKRDGLDKAWRAHASETIADRILNLPELMDSEPIGSYWPIRSEVDTREILAGFSNRGQMVALSQIRHPHLSWRQWRPGDQMIHGGFGVQEPSFDAPEVFPRVLLMPLAAFDRFGNRLGYGKGHFDRTIAELTQSHPVFTVGLAFSVQEIDAVPVEPHDKPLDLIVTEIGLIRPPRN